MQCPVCSNELKASVRQGIEIDLCPKCRGVWLDRGELDKIVERSNFQSRYDEDYDDDGPHDSGGHSREGRQREGFFSRLFDFDS
jgi:uncharacterized protein